jgi:hypothetical protein
MAILAVGESSFHLSEIDFVTSGTAVTSSLAVELPLSLMLVSCLVLCDHRTVR